MASKGKGKEKKSSKKEKAVEDPPPESENKKEDPPQDLSENYVTEQHEAEQEPPKELTPLLEPDEPSLAELIVEHYEGEMIRGLYDGDGVAYFCGGHEYKGQFLHGLMHGKGFYRWADGVTYEGEFTCNEITGKGLYNWPNGSSYDGEVLNGKRHGHGTFRCMSCPASYTGQWDMGKRQGTGIIRYDSDGLSFYEGDWVNNKRHGYGVRRYRSGNVYEGEWANNNRHGQGVMRWVDLNQSYNGLWKNGIQHGHGEHTWFLKRLPGSQYPMRNQFIGEFVNGKRHGYGVFLYANGAKYEGEWADNKKNGRGIFTFKNGRIFEGIFVEDRMAEFPTFTMDGTNTPDISAIRTRTPDPAGPGVGNLTSRSDDSRNTLGPSMTLDIDHLMNGMTESEKEDEIQQVMFVILRHITTLKKAYMYYSSLGFEGSPDNTFMMTKLQFWRFLKDCRFHLLDATLIEMDRFLVKGKETSADIHSPLDKLLIREYLNNVITLAYYLYRDDCPENEPSVISWCLSQAITENIIPYSCDVQGTFLFDSRRAVNALGYMDKCWEVYRSICRINKNPPYDVTVTMREFLFMMKDYRLINDRLTPKLILQILASDDPSAYDGSDCNMELEMTFLDFFEALIGCAMMYITEDLVKDPTTPRPSTEVSHTHTSFTSTSRASTSRASQNAESEVQGSTGGQSSHRETASRSGSPGREGSAAVKQQSTVDTSEKRSAMATVVEGTIEEGIEGAGDAGKGKQGKSEPDTDVKGPSIETGGDDGPSQEAQPHLLQSVLSLGDEENMEADGQQEDEMDEETREFNFWTHQINIFFLKKLFPAYEHMQNIIIGREKLRTEKEMAQIEAERKHEEREATRFAAKLAEETRAKELSVEQASIAESPIPEVKVEPVKPESTRGK